jgi:hypothetical protein
MPDEIIKLKIKPRAAKEEILIPVRVVLSGNNSALVEYQKNGIPTRATISVKHIVNKQVKESVLDKAIKNGIDWTEISFPRISERDIMRCLRNNGIWTADDARTKPGQVKAAIIQVTAPLVKTIFEFIKNK